MIPPGFFVSGTSTGVGKTFVTRGLARAVRRERALADVVAIKPIETGCAPDPLDAIALGEASGHPELVHHRGLYRAERPLAPYAATLAGETAPPSPEELAYTVKHLIEGHDLALVEGAGGVLVPLDGRSDTADLARELQLPVILVAQNGLGVLSFTLTAVETLRLRGIPLAAVVLTPVEGSSDDPSVESNAQILRERTYPAPVFEMPRSEDDDERLADAAVASGLVGFVLEEMRSPAGVA